MCGGEDFKIYKFDYITGNEIESFKGHFGPVHTISFSPDGELYASGSEDGTLRLWVSNQIKNDSIGNKIPLLSSLANNGWQELWSLETSRVRNTDNHALSTRSRSQLSYTRKSFQISN